MFARVWAQLLQAGVRQTGRGAMPLSAYCRQSDCVVGERCINDHARHNEPNVSACRARCARTDWCVKATWGLYNEQGYCGLYARSTPYWCEQGWTGWTTCTVR